MKNLMLLLITLFALSCKQKAIVPQENPQTKDSIVYLQGSTPNVDSIVQVKIDSVQESMRYLKQENIILLKRYDSLKVDNNKLAKDLLHNKLVIENARYYLNIVNKNPSQQKFLRGWMNRALNQ